MPTSLSPTRHETFIPPHEQHNGGFIRHPNLRTAGPILAHLKRDPNHFVIWQFRNNIYKLHTQGHMAPPITFEITRYGIIKAKDKRYLTFERFIADCRKTHLHDNAETAEDDAAKRS